MLRVALENMIDKLIVYGPVHNTTDKFELKTHQMFSVHNKLETLEKTVTNHFRFVFEERLGEEIHVITLTSLFLNSFVFNMFSVHNKT